ncbi:OLC1v1017507C4 [Oldenlandia corymbosa var. corymbosa]|uniref:OLC1v1017507C4 n=1 Tax=Oldenlandia corymbosa var. corymbosa TaxID=529605 RepID=A0AAV1E9L3_OLDCO|nr:OLC1v1017507C4 [Oldenlandia corymbosa var. corymbosa]
MGDTSDSTEVDEEKTVSKEQLAHDSLTSEGLEGKATAIQIPQEKETPLGQHVDSSSDKNEAGASPVLKDKHEKDSSSDEKDSNSPSYVKLESLKELESLSINGKASEAGSGRTSNVFDATEHEVSKAEAVDPDETAKGLEGTPQQEEPEPVFDGTEIPSMESVRSSSDSSVDNETGIHGYAWPEKAVAVKNFVREKSLVAVSSFLRRLSGKSNDGLDGPDGEPENNNSSLDGKEVGNRESEVHEASPKGSERSVWNPLSLIKISREADVECKDELEDDTKDAIEPLAMKGRILLYTRLRCQDSKEARLFLHGKRLRYVEINVDVYPGRKLELEKLAGSSDVPRVFFNEILIGGLSELKSLDESGKLVEKIEYVVSEAPSFEAPLPPLSGEDDLSSSGSIDELALIVRKMKDNIVVKDRFYKMRRFTNCFLGSEAVDFLSEDQYLEREEAVEFGRKLASKLFLRHVLEENMFEDGSHLYRFLDDDPLISQCQNIPRGIVDVKPKPIIEISSRLRFLFYAILEAYTSEDGKHVDYRSIHGSEEFARFLRILEELQRVELQDMPREEKLSFFINLYNMMAIHAILVWGHPSGALERRKLFGEFKYVIGGCTFSLSAVYNGILRANQRPPYNLIKPFSTGDKRIKMILPYPEPLVHFALVNGTRSGPSLRCYSPGDIDKELMEAAHNFIKSQGLLVDFEAKVAYASKILKWYSSDFGKNEVEVIKHASNYLDPEQSQAIMELLSSTQLKVVYLSYDWRLNH